MKKIITILILFSVLSVNKIVAQQQLKNIIIDEKERVFLYFKNYPIIYKSDLSEDKTKIIINLNNSTAADTVRLKQGKGKINDVYVQTQKNKISIFISMSEQVGYTAVPLPFSRSILVETFRWDKLSPIEDTLRQGLLALEDNIQDVARKFIFSASMQCNPLATFFMGLIFLQEGKINSALHYLRYAELNNVDIPDLYAAISQIYSLKNHPDSANKYSLIFQNKTGFSYTPKINIYNIVESDTIFLEPISHLHLTLNAKSDTIKTTTDTSEIAKKFEKIFTDTLKKEDEIPAIYNQILTYVGGVILGIILLIVYLYLRWRQKQLQDIAKTTKAKTTKKSHKTEEKKSPDTATQLIAAKTYAKQQKPSTPENKSNTEIQPETIQFKEKQEALTNIIQEIRSEQENKETKKQNEDLKTQKESEPTTKSKPISAKIEIAMNLVEEQRKIKQKNIEQLGKTIEIEMSRLTEIARSLGIEKGSLETRKAIENIQNDPEKLRNFLQKFKKD